MATKQMAIAIKILENFETYFENIDVELETVGKQLGRIADVLESALTELQEENRQDAKDASVFSDEEKARKAAFEVLKHAEPSVKE